MGELGCLSIVGVSRYNGGNVAVCGIFVCCVVGCCIGYLGLTASVKIGSLIAMAILF